MTVVIRDFWDFFFLRKRSFSLVSLISGMLCEAETVVSSKNALRVWTSELASENESERSYTLFMYAGRQADRDWPNWSVVSAKRFSSWIIVSFKNISTKVTKQRHKRLPYNNNNTVLQTVSSMNFINCHSPKLSDTTTIIKHTAWFRRHWKKTPEITESETQDTVIDGLAATLFVLHLQPGAVL